MSKELIERLRAEIARTVELDVMHHEAANRIEKLEKQVKMLRDALIHLTHNAKTSGANMRLALDISAKALAAPTDTTALREPAL